MKYLSGSEVAKLLKITVRRVQQMCKNGELSGAIKIGRMWQIPEDAVVTAENMDVVKSEKKKPLPIGISDYREASTNYYYVDKTLLLRDFIDNQPKVSLFTRPRRFGKTLNMDMLRVFFEKSDEDTSVYFKDKLIWKCGEEYTCYQGKYPVIFLTLKDLKCLTWDDTFLKIRELIAKEFLRHAELENSDKLCDYEKNWFSKIAEERADRLDYESSLSYLSMLLHKHHGEKPVIIIDEYDVPIQQGHVYGFYKEVVIFMRNFFSGGFKDNPHLKFGFMTGILRVAKESIFSGLNNLAVHSVLDNKYSSYFGFTADEVKDIAAYYGVPDKFGEISDWYDGYMFGKTEIFNPWSVINYFYNECIPGAYWQATSSNDVVGEIISQATPEITENLHKLMSGETIIAYVDTSVIYPEIQNDPFTVYSFLLLTGYLKVEAIYPQDDGNYMCGLSIPNKEISGVYGREILNRTNCNSIAVSIAHAIFTGDANKLQVLLEQFMIQSVSSFDGTNESFYHGMMLGLCALLNNRYQVRSNRETGLGRFDIMLMPKVKSMPGFIYEFKYTKDSSKDLDLLADEALEQIEDKKYDTELHAQDISSIIKIGIAFRGKEVVVKSKGDSYE